MPEDPTEENYPWPPRGAPPKELRTDLGYPSDFQGMNLDQAYARFCDNPFSYPDDFRWMQEDGFHYYFPVIDRYLRSVRPDMPLYDYPILALPSCIQTHFDCHENMSGLHEPILALCDFILAHLPHYDLDQEYQEDLRERWSDLRQQVADDARGIRRPRL